MRQWCLYSALSGILIVIITIAYLNMWEHWVFTIVMMVFSGVFMAAMPLIAKSPVYETSEYIMNIHKVYLIAKSDLEKENIK